MQYNISAHEVSVLEHTFRCEVTTVRYIVYFSK